MRKLALIFGLLFAAAIPVFGQAPTISQTWPQSGVVGLAVDIDGTNFGSTQGTSTVTFNGTAATATNWTPTVISVTVPAGATTGNIVVTTSSGNASIAFTVRPAPSLTPPTCGISGNAANIIPNATDWKNFTPPAVGSTYQDTIANMGWGPGCAVTRLTNSIATFGDTDSFNHYYALVEPMSEADTKVLIGDQEQGPYEIVSGPALGLTPGTVIVSHANISPACGQSNTHGVATWDRYNDMVFYQTFNNTLQKVTVSANSAGATLSCTTVHTFTEYSYLVNLMNEPRMTPDGWISMVGQNVQGSNFDMFLFNPATGAKTPTLSSSVIPCTADINAPNNSCVHGLESTVRDGLFISVAAVSESLIWESPWTSATQWPISGPHSTGHQEFGADFNGNDSNFNESDGGVGGCGGDQPAMQLLPAGTTVNCLFAADSHSLGGWDISYLNWPNTAFVLYSTQSQAQNCAEYFPFLFGGAANPNYCDPSGTSWVYAYNNEILSVRTDANNSSSHIYRLTLAHSFELTYSGTTFTADPRAAMSFDGRYVIFDNNSAWANGTNNCVNTDSSPSAACADVYMIDLQQGGGSPAVSLSPTSLSFGNQNVSTTSAQQVVTLTNTGTATLTISSVALTTGTQFAFATPGSGSDCRTVGTVAASGTCNIAVTFTPTSAGAQSDTVSITDNAAGSPHTFGVSGTGIAAGGGSTMNGGVSINGGMVSN